jgi:hypothetical protein
MSMTISIIYQQKYSLEQPGAIGHVAYFQRKKDLRLLMLANAGRGKRGKVEHAD